MSSIISIAIKISVQTKHHNALTVYEICFMYLFLISNDKHHGTNV